MVLACLRRVQGWCFTAVLGELRHNVWPHKLFDYEQAIESFKKSLVDTTKNKPDYLAVHYAMSVSK